MKVWQREEEKKGEKIVQDHVDTTLIAESHRSGDRTVLVNSIGQTGFNIVVRCPAGPARHQSTRGPGSKLASSELALPRLLGLAALKIAVSEVARPGKP